MLLYSARKKHTYLPKPEKTEIMSCRVYATCLRVSALGILLLFFQSGFSQVDTLSISTHFSQQQKEAGGNLAIMIYKDNKVLYSKANADFPPNTQVHIGSSSKWLVAAMLMMLVDEGKLNLDEKITKYIPIYQPYGKAYITIRHCLDNLTGIEGDKGEGIGGNGKSLEEEVNSYASKHEIETNAGTQFKYSNIGTNIVARVIEVVSKRDFEQVIQQRLLRPLAMRNTTFQFDFDKGVSPANGAYSTASDYLNFLGMLLNKGMFKGKRIMSEKAISMLEQADIEPAAIKYAPKLVAGLAYAPGAWILERDAAGKPTCLTSPSLAGIWPVLDLCRGYASIIFVKTVQTDGGKQLFDNIKKTIDAQLACGN